jgi:hypothetical protein
MGVGAAVAAGPQAVSVRLASRVKSSKAVLFLVIVNLQSKAKI